MCWAFTGKMFHVEAHFISTEVNSAEMHLNSIGKYSCVYFLGSLEPVDIKHSMLEIYSIQLCAKGPTFVMEKINNGLTGGNISPGWSPSWSCQLQKLQMAFVAL